MIFSEQHVLPGLGFFCFFFLTKNSSFDLLCLITRGWLYIADWLSLLKYPASLKPRLASDFSHPLSTVHICHCIRYSEMDLSGSFLLAWSTKYLYTCVICTTLFQNLGLEFRFSPSMDLASQSKLSTEGIGSLIHRDGLVDRQKHAVTEITRVYRPKVLVEWLFRRWLFLGSSVFIKFSDYGFRDSWSWSQFSRDGCRDACSYLYDVCISLPDESLMIRLFCVLNKFANIRRM